MKTIENDIDLRCQECRHFDMEHDNFGDCTALDKRTSTGLCKCDGLALTPATLEHLAAQARGNADA